MDRNRQKLIKYLADYIRQEIDGSDAAMVMDDIDNVMIEMAIDAFESTENLKLEIKGV